MPEPYRKRGSRLRDVLLTGWVIGLLVLMIGGGGAGAVGATRAAEAAGLLDAEPALGAPAAVAGIAVGGLAGLGIALLVRWFPAIMRERTVARLVALCVLATALGAVLYLLAVGGLVWLAGLVLPGPATKVVA